MKIVKLLAIFATGFYLSCVLKIITPLGEEEVVAHSNTREGVLDMVFTVALKHFPQLTPDDTELFIGHVPLDQAKYPLDNCIITIVPKIMALGENLHITYRT